MLGLAFVVAASAVALRRRLRGGPERKPVQPLGAARMAVLGKASAHVGPLLGGCYAGYALLLLPALDVEVRRDRATVAVVAFVASLLLTAAGLWLERICRVSGGDDQDAPPPVPSV